MDKRLKTAEENREDLINKFQGGEKECAKFKLDYENLKRQIEELKIEISRAKLLREGEEKKKRSIDMEKKYLEEQITMIQMQLDKSKSNEKMYEQFVKENQSLKVSIAELTTEKDKLDKELKSLESRVSLGSYKSHSSIQRLKRDNDQLQQKIFKEVNLERESGQKALDQMKHEMKLRLTAFDVDIDDMKRSYEKMKNENKNIKRELMRVQDKIEVTKNDKLTFTNKVELLESQYTKLKENNEIISKERSEILSQLKTKTIEFDELRIKLNIAESNRQINLVPPKDEHDQVEISEDNKEEEHNIS